MKSNVRFALVLLVCGAVLVSSTWFAWGATTAPKRRTAPPTAGMEAAKTLSMVTGVAISPLLGVGAVGAYQYYKAPPESRANLAWFAQPWFWVPALLLVGVVALKDTVGTAAPSALKKPFDIAELAENKVSALIAAGAFIPLVISVFPKAPGTEGMVPFVDPAAMGFAAISAGSIGNALLVPVAIIVFAVVWLASHAINVLIVISPFTTIDTALKSLRLLLLGLVAGTSFANPYVGAVLAAVVVVISYFLAGWSFRLMVFGSNYLWDFFTFRSGRFQPGANANLMFTARKLLDLPIRTRGKLARNEAGALSFQYRPWLILKERSIVVSAANYCVGKGMFYSEIDQMEAERTIPTFILPPRYRGHEPTLARVYNFAGVQDVGLRKGFKAMWVWLKGFFGVKRAETPLQSAPVA